MQRVKPLLIFALLVPMALWAFHSAYSDDPTSPTLYNLVGYKPPPRPHNVVTGVKASGTGNLTGVDLDFDTGTIDTFTFDEATGTTITVTDLTATDATITNLTATDATITNLTVTDITADHGQLDGLADDDHPQYILNTDLDTEAELESQLTDVTDVYTNNDTLIKGMDLTNTRHFWNGTFQETFNLYVTSDGVSTTATLEQSGGGDLTMQFSDGYTVLDCTPAAELSLTNGTDTAPNSSYIYITQASKVLAEGASWPSEEHIRVAYCLVPSATFVQANGCYINQNWNDHLRGTDDQGHLAHVAAKVRSLGSTYYSGVNPNGATASYYTISASNTEWLSTSGEIFQMHTQSFPAIDTSTGDVLLVKNWSGDAYHDITDLYSITADSTGSAIATNRYFSLVFWGINNKSTQYSTVVVNLPSGVYVLQNDAEVDANGYDDYTIPPEFALYSSTGFLICRSVFQMGASSWTHIETTDLRGKTPTNAGGSTVNDHGSLGGLADDDHASYPLVTDFEADRATIITNWFDLTAGGLTGLHAHQHHDMAGLSDDDHTLYYSSSRVKEGVEDASGSARVDEDYLFDWLNDHYWRETAGNPEYVRIDASDEAIYSIKANSEQGLLKGGTLEIKGPSSTDGTIHGDYGLILSTDIISPTTAIEVQTDQDVLFSNADVYVNGGAGNDLLIQSGSDITQSGGGTASFGVTDIAGTFDVVGGLTTVEDFQATEIDVTSGGIDFTGTAGGGGQSITYEDTTNAQRIAMQFSSNTVYLENQASNGEVQIYANTSTAGSGGRTQVAKFEDTQVSFYLGLVVDEGNSPSQVFAEMSAFNTLQGQMLTKNSDGDTCQLIMFGRAQSGTQLGQNRAGQATVLGSPNVLMAIGTSTNTPVHLATNDTTVLKLTADGALQIPEISTTPSAPAAGAAVNLYMKSDKIIFQFVDGATTRYKYLDLTGTGVTWTHTTSAP